MDLVRSVETGTQIPGTFHRPHKLDCRNVEIQFIGRQSEFPDAFGEWLDEVGSFRFYVRLVFYLVWACPFERSTVAGLLNHYQSPISIALQSIRPVREQNFCFGRPAQQFLGPKRPKWHMRTSIHLRFGNLKLFTRVPAQEQTGFPNVMLCN